MAAKSCSRARTEPPTAPGVRTQSALRRTPPRFRRASPAASCSPFWAGAQVGLEPGDPLGALRSALAFDEFFDQRIFTLSAGMRQRLAIFCAFLTRPRAVLLDEPFNWLDPICAFDTKQALGALVAAEGLTLVTALHDLTSLVHHCSAGVFLSDGRIRRLLGPKEMAEGQRDYAAFEAEMIAGLRDDTRHG